MAEWSISYDGQTLPDWELERIADMIRQGYTSGELRDYTDCIDCAEPTEDEELDEAGRCPCCHDKHEEDETESGEQPC